MDGSLPGSAVHGIFQARILEWAAISPGDLPNPGIEHGSPALQTDTLPSEPLGKSTSRMILLKLQDKVSEAVLLQGAWRCRAFFF